MLTIDVVTLFPEVIAPYVETSIPGRAAAAGLVQFRLVRLRDFTHDRHCHRGRLRVRRRRGDGAEAGAVLRGGGHTPAHRTDRASLGSRTMLHPR